MIYNRLGQTDLNVSHLCLGTMTWGEQNSEAEAHEHVDVALAAGINFIDTAEMYPVPPRVETYGLTETYIGTWLKKRANRDQVIIASKVMSRSRDLNYVRGGDNRLNRKHIEAAINASLQRLQTDYIDLYQLHWPDRNSNYFGRLGYQHDVHDQPVLVETTLQVLTDQIKAGKIRYIGLSNETPWGVMQFIHWAEKLELPRVVSIQNPYNLLNRSFEIGLAEIAHHEAVGLMAYSPLGFGTLSGKYLGKKKPDNARLTRYERFTRYTNPQAIAATREYVELAHAHDLDPAQMALAFVNSRTFLTSNIIGTTNLPQLRSNIDSLGLTLSDDVLKEIEQIHRRIPTPSP